MLDEMMVNATYRFLMLGLFRCMVVNIRRCWFMSKNNYIVNFDNKLTKFDNIIEKLIINSKISIVKLPDPHNPSLVVLQHIIKPPPKHDNRLDGDTK